MTMTSIFRGDDRGEYYLRPIACDPRTHAILQRNVYYVFNGRCSVLGNGAMGKVYLCHAYGQPANKAAVKLVAPHFSSNRKIRERAKMEATLAFNHPNIIEMLGYCELYEDHGPFLILSRYFEGENVDKYVNQLPATPERTESVCRLMIQVVSALQYLHTLNVIHRDIKPSNIMVNASGQVKLMDLGIAHSAANSKLSTVGFIGTPEYAAPELMRVTEEDLDAAGPYTDIYSLGITFYELLTGLNPFKSSSQAETLTRQRSMKLPANSAVPKQLMKVLWKATEKAPERRYQSAVEFGDAINHAISQHGNWLERTMGTIKHWFYTN